ERPGLVPVGGAGGAVPDAGDTVGVDGELERGGALGAEGALVDRAFGVALYVDDLPVADGDELAAADGTVGADARDLADADDAAGPGLVVGGRQVEAEREQAAEGKAAARRGLEEVTPTDAAGGHAAPCGEWEGAFFQCRRRRREEQSTSPA